MKPRILAALLLVIALAVPARGDVDGTTSLKESVLAAVQHHPQIKSLLYNRDAQASNLAAALGRFFPSLDIDSNYGFQEYSSTSTRNSGSDDRSRTQSDTTVTLTQNVFDGLDRVNDLEGSEHRLESAEYRLLDNVETIGLDAVRAHIDVVRERTLVRMATDNITSHQEVLESIAERVAGGAGSKADEMQARGRVARAESTLITYLSNLRIAETEYRRITGDSPGPLKEPGYMPELIPADLDPILEASLDENPKVLIAQAEVEATRSDRNVTRSTFMPTVDIEVSSRYTNNLDGADTYLRDDKAQLAMTWNLFNGGSDYSDVKAANARIREAEEELRDTVEDMTQQVFDAWTEYETALASIDKFQEALQYSMESRDMYLMQFNVGQRSLLDVLDSINEVFSNEVQLETAKSNRNFTVYKLVTLQGRLVKALEMSKATYDPE